MNMRVKPRDEWHNFDVSNEIKLGKIEVAVSFNAVMLRRLVEYMGERVGRGTGIRFKFVGNGARVMAEKGEGPTVLYQVFSKDDTYIFPNKSPHTNRYDSPYNRVELYVPLHKLSSDPLKPWTPPGKNQG